MNSNKTCKTCNFYAAPLEGDINGEVASECRRFPPAMCGGDRSEQRGVFPITGESDWCGEFRLAGQDSPMAKSHLFHSASVA